LRRSIFIPRDVEGLYVLGEEGVKVYEPAVSIQSEEAANMLGQAVFEGANIAILKGHGPFAIASTIFEAYKLISCLEASCEIADL
jgi:ribulose-5-phosphate 4-epimerase/fuculose-1-phosphate aldolase